MGHPRSWATWAASSEAQRIRAATLFRKFTCRSEARPKRRRISFTAMISPGEGWQSRITSSAYREITGMVRRGWSCCSTRGSTARRKSRPSVSTAKTKSCGDTGSPLRSPHRCQNVGPGVPFKRTLVLADDNRRAIQSRKRLPKMWRRKTSKRNVHETESKARAKSSLSCTRGAPSWCRSRADWRTRTKLSWRLRPGMKAFWTLLTSLLSLGARRSDNTFARILATRWMRLMGL